MDRQIELKLGEQEDVLRSFSLGANMPALIETKARRPKAVKARPLALSKEVSARDAFRLTLLQCKAQIADNVAAVAIAHEVEGVHQMRIGFRRLRVAFTAFGDDFRSGALNSLKARAEKLSAKLAPARDLDVFVEELLEPAVHANGKLEGFDLLRARANEARRQAWDFAIAHVTSESFADFFDDLGHAVESEILLGESEDQVPAADIASRILDQRFHQAKDRAKHLKDMSAHKRHKLRIALKKLRYTAEFFAPLYGAHRAKDFLKSLSRMQDVLGALNDVAVAKETLEKLTRPKTGEDHDALSFAAGMVYGWHLDRAGHIWRGAKKRWKRLEKCEPFWAN
jgi:CHAD domain-containing protein